MDDSQLEIVFEMMGERLGNGKNRSAKCPLAPWTHPHGLDKRPSLTAKADTVAVYKCWSCKNSGSVKNLARLYAQHSGDSRAYEFVKACEGDGSSSWGIPAKYGAWDKRLGKMMRSKMDVSDDAVKRWAEQIPNFAFERGMTEAQVLRWEIGYDPSQERLTIPIRDYAGALIGASGRALLPDQQPKYRHYPGTKKEKVLFGENHKDIFTSQCFIVEGFFDVFAMERYGIKNCFAVMGTSLSEDQQKKVKDWFVRAIFLPDLDDSGAGIQFCQVEGEKLCRSGMKVGVAGVTPNPYYHPRKKPILWEPFDFMFDPLDELKGKDPGDWTKEELKLALRTVSVIKVTPNGVRAELFHPK